MYLGTNCDDSASLSATGSAALAGSAASGRGHLTCGLEPTDASIGGPNLDRLTPVVLVVDLDVELELEYRKDSPVDMIQLEAPFPVDTGWSACTPTVPT